MDVEVERIVSGIVGDLENAWNTADGAGFARPFAEAADFVNIRGEHVRTREAIAEGHQGIFATIFCRGSVVRYRVAGVRSIAPGVVLVHVTSTLNAPTGPLAGEHHSLFSMVLVQERQDWRIAAFHNTLVR